MDTELLKWIAIDLMLLMTAAVMVFVALPTVM